GNQTRVYKWFCSLEKKEVKFVGYQIGNPQFCKGKIYFFVLVSGLRFYNLAQIYLPINLSFIFNLFCIVINLSYFIYYLFIVHLLVFYNTIHIINQLTIFFFYFFYKRIAFC